MAVFVGNAIQRDFTAASDQSGELTVNGTSAGAGAIVAKLVNAPSCENSAGGTSVFVVPERESV